MIKVTSGLPVIVVKAKKRNQRSNFSANDVKKQLADAGSKGANDLLKKYNVDSLKNLVDSPETEAVETEPMAAEQPTEEVATDSTGTGDATELPVTEKKKPVIPTKKPTDVIVKKVELAPPVTEAGMSEGVKEGLIIAGAILILALVVFTKKIDTAK